MGGTRCSLAYWMHFIPTSSTQRAGRGRKWQYAVQEATAGPCRGAHAQLGTPRPLSDYSNCPYKGMERLPRGALLLPHYCTSPPAAPHPSTPAGMRHAAPVSTTTASKSRPMTTANASFHLASTTSARSCTNPCTPGAGVGGMLGERRGVTSWQWWWAGRWPPAGQPRFRNGHGPGLPSLNLGRETALGGPTYTPTPSTPLPTWNLAAHGGHHLGGALLPRPLALVGPGLADGVGQVLRPPRQRLPLHE